MVYLICPLPWDDLIFGQEGVGEGCPGRVVLDLLCRKLHKPVEICNIGDHLTASTKLVYLSRRACVTGVVNVDAEKSTVNLTFVGIDHAIAVIITPDIYRTVPLAQCEVLSTV